MDGLSDGSRASGHRGLEILVAEYEEKSNPVSGLSQLLASRAAWTAWRTTTWMDVSRLLLAGRPRCSTLQLSYVNG